MKLRALFNQLLFVFILQIVFLNSFSQNVGIGTTSPAEKLEVKNPLRSTLKISSSNYADTSELLLSNRNISQQGTDFSLKNIREEGLSFSSLSDLSNNTSLNSFVIKSNGNVGINTYTPTHRFEVAGASYFNGNVGVGVTSPANKFEVSGNSLFSGFVGLGATPTVRLEIAGAVKLQGTNAFEFGSGIAGKEINAGKLGYQVFTADALDIIGAGTNNTNRKIKLWAEGGTTLAGSLGIGGALQVNGNPGTSGQVLTSNGTSAPQWKNTSFSNTTRFAADIPPFALGSLPTYNSIYNYDPTTVTINSSGITLNRAGLYHFEGSFGTQTVFTGSTAPNGFYLTLDLVIGITFISIENYKQPEKLVGFGNLYTSLSKFSLDFYLTAGTTVWLSLGNAINYGSATLSSSSYSGKLTGYLISD